MFLNQRSTKHHRYQLTLEKYSMNTTSPLSKLSSEVVEAPTFETFIQLSPKDAEALHGASHEALLHAQNPAYLELFAAKQALQSLCAQLVQAHRLLQ
jgi:hypothetical protein